jgi:hypothetical protein
MLFPEFFLVGSTISPQAQVRYAACVGTSLTFMRMRLAQPLRRVWDRICLDFSRLDRRSIRLRRQATRVRA